MSSDGAAQFRVGPDADPDRYALGNAFSSGAEGILYRGTITAAAGVTLDVAVKMLQPRFLTRVDEWHTRWTEQVELLRSLQVPGVVTVRDGFLGPLPHPPGQAGEAETLYLVMNWVEGESLDEWIRHRPDRNPIDDLKMLVPVAAALDLMHSGRATGGVPIVHRDIKPANILVTENGSVLVDFGLTRGLPDGQRLTGVVGTPGYLAPESTEAGSYSPASDRYAFGAVAYFVLTGSEPPASHQPEVMRSSLVAVQALAERPEVAEQVMAMLASDPDERPPGAANWVGQLRRSSLDPGPDVLNPAAPQRNPARTRHRGARGTRRRIGSRPVVLSLVVVLLAALVLTGLEVSSTRKHSASEYSQVPGRISPDHTCGRGGLMPFGTPTSPVSLATGPEQTIVGVNDANGVGASSDNAELMGFYNCNPEPADSSTGVASMQPSGKATTLADLVAMPNGDLYVAGYSADGWIVERLRPDGTTDPKFVPDASFGTGGYSSIQRQKLSVGGYGKLYAVSLSHSGEIFVLGSDGVGQVLVVALTKSGELDRTFGTDGVLTTNLPIGVATPTLSVASDGNLLVGGSGAPSASSSCDYFYISEYRAKGELVGNSEFDQIAGFGAVRSGKCKGGNVPIPTLDSTQLTSILSLSGGEFVAVGNGSIPVGVDLKGRVPGGFLCWHESNGRPDNDIGVNNDGVVTIGGPSDPATQLAAVTEPDGGIVTGYIAHSALFLLPIAPSGVVGKKFEVNATGPPSTFAMANTGKGKILIVSASAASGYWTIARYHYVTP